MATLDLSEKKIAIGMSLENLVNSIKIYDTGSIFTTGFSLTNLKGSEVVQLTTTYVTNKIKNTKSPINYEQSNFNIPFVNGKIDLVNLAKNLKSSTLTISEAPDNVDYNNDGDKLDTFTYYTYTRTGVETALKILNSKENN